MSPVEQAKLDSTIAWLEQVESELTDYHAKLKADAEETLALYREIFPMEVSK